MRLVLKNGTAIELCMGNNQKQFVVSTEVAQEAESLLTADNLSDAHYEINDTVTETLKNKVVSGSNKDLIRGKVTYYLTDANDAEIERLKATVSEQEETICNMQSTVDELILLMFEQVENEPNEEPTEESEEE